jgi:hypothetical protein
MLAQMSYSKLLLTGSLEELRPLNIPTTIYQGLLYMTLPPEQLL